MIDLEDCFEIILDEMSDRSDEGGLINILHATDYSQKSICLDSIYTVGSPVAEEMLKLFKTR